MIPKITRAEWERLGQNKVWIQWPARIDRRSAEIDRQVPSGRRKAKTATRD